jgi:hypothetical protein
MIAVREWRYPSGYDFAHYFLVFIVLLSGIFAFGFFLVVLLMPLRGDRIAITILIFGLLFTILVALAWY